MRHQSVNRDTFSCLHQQLTDSFWIILIVNIFLLSNNIDSILAIQGADTLRPSDCPNSIEHCSKDMKTILNDTRFTFAQNDVQLDILCLHLNRSITCINKFIECDSMSTLKKDSINPMLHLMDKLCSKSSKFRIEYLKHAECYHRLAPVYEKCYQLYYISERKRGQLQRNITEVTHLLQWCCNYKNHRKCTNDPVRRACGSEAANLAEQIVIISHGHDALDNCPKNLSSSSCLVHWDSLGLLANTTYHKDGNMDFLTSEGKFLYPDYTSGSLSSSITIKGSNGKSGKTFLGKLFSKLSVSLIQLMSLMVIIIIHGDLNFIIDSLTIIKLSPSVSRQLTPSIGPPISPRPLLLMKSFNPNGLESDIKGKSSQSKT